MPALYNIGRFEGVDLTGVNPDRRQDTFQGLVSSSNSILGDSNLSSEQQDQAVNEAIIAAGGSSSLSGGGTTSDVGADPLTGLVSPMDARSATSIQDDKEEQRRLTRETADVTFDPIIERAKEAGAAQLSTGQGVTGQSQGFNMSTAEATFINSIQTEITDNLAALDKQKANFIATGDFNAAKLADEQIFKMTEANNKLILQKADLALKQQTQKTAAEQFQQTFAQNRRLLEFQLNEESRTISAEERQIAQQEREAVQGLKVQFPNVGIDSGDSIDVAIEKAADLIDETRKLQLEQLKADVARTRQLANGDGDGTGTSGEDNGLKILLDQDPETGEWIVNSDRLIDFVSQTGNNRLEIANSASALADQLNSAAAIAAEGVGEGVDAQPRVDHLYQFSDTLNPSGVSLKDRASELIARFPGSNQVTLNRKELISEGFSPADVEKAVPKVGIRGAAENVGDFFSGLLGGVIGE